MHIPVENEHLFRFKMNADSGLRVPDSGHLSARTLMSDEPSCSNVLDHNCRAALAAGLFSESKRCLPSKAQLLLEESLSAYFFPEMGVHRFRNHCSQLHPEYALGLSTLWSATMPSATLLIR